MDENNTSGRSPRVGVRRVPLPTSLRDRLVELRLRISIAALLIEMDRRCGFTGFLTYAAGKATRSTDPARDLFACQIGQSCNLGLVAMAEAWGISYDQLAWTAERHLREDSLRAVIVAVVNYHHRGMMSLGVGSQRDVIERRATVPHERQIDLAAVAVAVLRR